MDPQQWEILQKMLAARQGGPGVPGMAGTPGGPVRESPTMQEERIRQAALGALLGIGGGVAGGMLGGGLGTMVNPAFGVLSGVTMAGQGAMPGVSVMENSMAPNIRDVYADQLRMKMQGN